MIDPFNTSKHDGASCHFCGDDALDVDTVNGQRLPTCDACHDTQIDFCPECEKKFIVRDGVQINPTKRTCQSCAREIVDVALGRYQELANDERKHL